MHKIAIFYMLTAMQKTGTTFPGHRLVILALVVPLCAVVGRWAAKQPGLRYAFVAPWVRERATTARRRDRLVPAE